MLLLQPPHVIHVRAAARVPHVAELPRPPDRSVRASTNPDLRLRRRQRLRRRVVERPQRPLVVARPAPDRPHHPDHLVAAPPATLERHAEELVLGPVPAHADAETHAPARQLLQRRDLLRQVHRVVQRGEDDRRPEPDPRREPGDPPERDERRVDTAVRVDSVRADDDVLRRPHRVEAELLGKLCDTADPVGRRIPAVVWQDHPEVHDPRLTAARVARLATTDPDGRPHLVPIVFAIDGDTLYSAVDAKPKRSRKLRRVENARARPDVTVLVDHYDEDWAKLWWIRL